MKTTSATERVTNKELAEVAWLDKMATPGPWVADNEKGPFQYAVYPTNDPDPEYLVSEGTMENAAFIAAARTLLPRLAAEVTALRAERDQHDAIEAALREQIRALTEDMEALLADTK